MKRMFTWLGLIPKDRSKAEFLYADFIDKDVILFYEDAKGQKDKKVIQQWRRNGTKG